MQATDFNNAINFISNNSSAIDEVKVTSLIRSNFNPMEGNQVAINVKLLTDEKHKNKLFTIMTNDTYMEDFSRDNEKQDLTDYLNTVVMS